jgi:hypothetical protein
MSQLRGKSLRGAQFITTSQTYTVPANYTQLRMILVSAGGGTGVGAGAGGGGGGGIVTTTSFRVQGGDALAIVIGQGAAHARGGATSVTNSRTAEVIAARQGFAGVSAVGLVGGRGGASFDEFNGTYAGGAGAGGPGTTGPYGGGGAGAGTVGMMATTSTVGTGAPARIVALNTTQTVYLSPGGAGVGPIPVTGTVILTNVGEGASYLDQAGGAGVVIIY